MLLRILLLLCALAPALAVRADLLPANGADSAPNFAEISLLKGRVQVSLEVDFRDLPAFVSPGGPVLIRLPTCRAGLVRHFILRPMASC